MNCADFTFFEKSLRETRKLKSYTFPYYVVDAVPEIFGSSPNINSPKMLSINENPETRDGEYIFETTSYATGPGNGLAGVQEMVGTQLPPDLIAFYERYEEALVVTRTYPLHLWSEEKIIEKIKWFREFFDKPFRVFRFGDQYDREATQFALWLEEPGTMKWRVISTAIGIIDDMDDDYVKPDRIIGRSFHEWLKDWIERDGLPDLFMQLGPEGGFLDPV